MPRQQKKEQLHDHPGGSGAVFGVSVMRNSSVQAITLVVGNAMQLVSVMVVAAFLGPDEMARFALLIFLAGLVTQVASLLCKPGTVRRTFGGGDDDDDDDDDDETGSSPPRTLGTGLAWAIVLGLVATVLIYVLRRPVADVLLGDPQDENLVALAGLLSGALLVFKICDIVLWLERRPGAYLVADTARPLLGLAVLTAFLATGAGVEGALLGTFVGTALAGLAGLVLLRGSFEPSFDLHEIGQIIKRGGYRAPIVMSFWLVQNADIFILSRFVDHSDLGVYSLASRLGFIVSFLPQGFRMGMRPLRKSAVFDAFKDQYGKATAQGQLLGYFTLVCILAVLAMVLLGEVLVDIAPPSYAAAAGVIPLTAIGFVMPALYRTVNQNVNIARKRPLFIAGAVTAAALFIGVTWALAGEIGVYAAPIGMIVGFGVPTIALFLRGQLGGKPIAFPFREVLTALVLAAAIAGGAQLLPEINRFVELAIALLLVVLWIVLLPPLRAIPPQHWRPLVHMLRSFRRGTPASFRPRRGLRALDPAEREELRRAVVGRLPAERLAPEAGDEGLRLVRELRRAGQRGGMPVGEPTEHDAAIAVCLFEDASTAVRNATMRGLLELGVDANDLRSLEDLVAHLSRVPDDGWEGTRGAERPRQLPGVARRRRVARRRELRAAQTKR
ncbi:MAG: oligosaccharide flippase family protein [Solirubrobacterales bacterium]|nr:oligosaccharide flippase family protein [Solirubrobacterales bacterium]